MHRSQRFQRWSSIARPWVPPERRLDASEDIIISTYRALLRAAGYLPDSFARRYTYERIKSRFRTSRAKSSKLALKGDPTSDFTKQRLQKAKRSRKVLENAGNGDMDALKKILLAVHGREGERKRILLNQLLQPDEDTLPKDASALQDLINRPKETSKPEGMPSQKLYHFIKTQQENQPVEAHKGKLRQLKPKIPKENIWGRPLPAKSKKSIQRKWWIATLDKILPPIPRIEWERLRDLATGAAPLEAQPVRRKPISIDTEELSADEKNKELLQYFQAPARPKTSKSYEFQTENGVQIIMDDGLEASKAKKAELRARKEKRKQVEIGREANRLAQLDELNPPIEHSEVEKIEIRNRSLRRLYASIWSLTPTMTYDDVNRKWEIIWGGQKSRALEGVVAKPTRAEEELFEGLDTLPQSLSQAGKDKLRNRDVKRTLKEEASGHFA
ncbi:hypothetical protein ONS95_011131 [Cadophora gregata]|uniref:uncharacterized protein n=1 Tax=Cadophora gregata TaxID=51156 RepID=UPI0026DAB320|nr:uncharacterized protein ONS95_011131 [Cadophora gregata]KAK0119695.1 hypothetical protein ONS95_011131 [Cadophora gregata]KAK0120730.1 hypothetical protein ONS96_010933 [Cadophora gregata f. sp. sojae]